MLLGRNDYTSSMSYSDGLLTVEDFYPSQAQALQKIRAGSRHKFGGPEIEQISDHMEKHEKPLTEEGFGFYLAGLIEGSGYFGDQ